MNASSVERNPTYCTMDEPWSMLIIRFDLIADIEKLQELKIDIKPESKEKLSDLNPIENL